MTQQAHTRAAWWLATFFGIGYLRPGPGTYASIAATLVWLAVSWSQHGDSWSVFVVTLWMATLTGIIGFRVSSVVSAESGIGDPQFVVIDEAAGQWTALLAACLPAPGWDVSLEAALVALVLFRGFDIWKPWPVSAFDRMHGGAGIMLDDIAAGVLAFLCVFVLRSTHVIS